MSLVSIRSSIHKLTRPFSQFVTAILCSIPFLLVRIVYSVLAAFAPLATFTSEGIIPGKGALAKFSSFGGSWEAFLFMGILMEFLVVCIYIFFGLTLPISMGEDELREQEKLQSAEMQGQGAATYYPMNNVNNRA